MINWKFTEENVTNVLTAWQDNAPNLSFQFNEDLSFVTSTLDSQIQQTINITGVYVLLNGQSCKNAIRDIKKNIKYLLKLNGKLNISSSRSYQEVYTEFVAARAYHNFSIGKTIFTTNNVSSKIIIKYMNEALNLKSRSLIGLQLMGGKISTVSSKHTAFYPRRAKFFIDIFNYWDSTTDQTASEKWNNKTFQSIFKHNGPFCYIGFPINGLIPFNYYGKNTKKLEKIKQKYDPLNLLNYPGSL
jgi:hypothetical protein